GAFAGFLRKTTGLIGERVPQARKAIAPRSRKRSNHKARPVPSTRPLAARLHRVRKARHLRDCSPCHKSRRNRRGKALRGRKRNSRGTKPKHQRLTQNAAARFGATRPQRARRGKSATRK